MMNQKDEFYIGYLPKAPKNYDKRSFTFIIFALLLLSVMAGILVISQRGFAKSMFEYGTLTQVKGIVSLKPIPNIKVIYGKDEEGQPIFQTIPLIGFGKFGAETILQKIAPNLEQDFDKTLLTLEGTLIHRDGKALLELTNEEGSFITQSTNLGNFNKLKPSIKIIGERAIKGEIVDPKCFFGVMKPAHSKPHRACAIRCISGGIPPFLWVEFENGSSDYYILRGLNGEAINKEVLSYVGDKIELIGNLELYDDWKLLFIDTNKIERIY